MKITDTVSETSGIGFGKPKKKKTLTTSKAKARAWRKEYLNRPGMKEKLLLQNNESRRKRKLADPIYAKALAVGCGLNWGKGSTVRLIELITINLGKKCIYCKEELTLKNISLDHKTPFIRSKKRGKSRIKPKYTEEQEKTLNAESNIHFICLICNRRKSNLSHEQFLSLVNFLDKDPEMKKLVLSRLGMANFRWKHF